MSTELMQTTSDTAMAELFTKLVLKSDLSSLSEPELVSYYHAVCNRAGLDPMTKPFEVLTLQGKKTLYATKTAAAQLTKIHGLSVNIVDKGAMGDTYFAQARVLKRDGSTVDDIGVVSIAGLKGEALSNAMMKAVTKAKRRAILAAFGVGHNDESEVEDLPGASLERHAINPAIAAPMHPGDQIIIDDFTVMLAEAQTAQELTDYVTLIKAQSSIVRDALRPVIAQTQERLNVVWKDGSYKAKQVQP